MNVRQRILAITLVVCAGVAAGFLSYRLQQRASLRPIDGLAVSAGRGAAAGSVADGAAAADAENAATPPAPRPVPATLPDVSLPDLSGTVRSLRSFSGHPLIINFWATWCAPCRREIPLLLALRQQHRAEKLEIVGVAVDFRSAVEQYLRHTPITYPLLVGEEQGLAAAEQFGMEAVLPFSVFADSRGRIVAVKIGELHRDEAQFIIGELHAVDLGSIEVAQAREHIEARLKELAVERAKAQQNSG
ncbi:MAG TPA: TlpA disulfide reductase family protein [Steroidobacteraceae bacterium]